MGYTVVMAEIEFNFVRTEGIVKGFANRRRLQILDLLDAEPELSVDQIAQRIKMGYMNASDHVRKMTTAGLLYKRNEGPHVRHTLTPRAKVVLAFCKKLK